MMNFSGFRGRCEAVLQWLGRPVGIAPLATLRIVVGAVMLGSTIRFMLLGWVEDHYLAPAFHFKYFGFEWVGVLPAQGMYTVHYLLCVSALCVLLGLFYRVSAILQFLLFTYTELIDPTYYLNHYYFVSIICGLLIFVPAHRSFSLLTLLRPGMRLSTVPYWCVFVFKFQLAVVYGYAGLWKINKDWLLHALPLKIWLHAQRDLPLIGFIFKWKITPFLFSWAGMLYDTTIVFWLRHPGARPAAFLSVVVFHVLTGILFQIGVFPVVMIAATLVFFSEKWHARLQEAVKGWVVRVIKSPQRLQRTQSIRSGRGSHALRNFYGADFGRGTRNLLYGLLLLHISFQLLFPLRYLLYPGNVCWTEQGYRFSWRVMLMEKAGTAVFYVQDRRTNKKSVVVNREYLNAHQEKQMAMQPDMILQFARFLRAAGEKRGLDSLKVTADVYVTLNGRPSKLLLDPAFDLSGAEDGWRAKPWILPEE